MQGLSATVVLLVKYGTGPRVWNSLPVSHNILSSWRILLGGGGRIMTWVFFPAIKISPDPLFFRLRRKNSPKRTWRNRRRENYSPVVSHSQLTTNNMVDDKKQRKITKKKLISIYTQTQNLSKNSFRRRASWTLGSSKWNSSWHNWTIRCCWF